MPKRKTHERFLEDFKLKNPHAESLLIVGEYQKAKEPIAVKCLKCGCEWGPTPSNLLSGYGCPECAGNRQKTHEEFVKLFAKKSRFANTMEFLEGYKGAFTPIKTRCITCGNEWHPLPTNLLKGDRGCPICSGSGKGSGERGKKIHKEFVEALLRANPKAESIEIIGCYTHSNASLEVRCKVCGYGWSVTSASLMQGSGCPRCAGRGSASDGKKTHAEFLSDFIGKNPFAHSIGLIGEYVDAKSEIKCVCAICGNVWGPTPDSLLHGSGCPVCVNKRRAISKTKTQEQFIEDFRARHPYADCIEITGVYFGDSSPIDVRCSICGHHWRPIATHLLSHPTGCPRCAKNSTSFMEQYILSAFQTVLGEDHVVGRDKDAIGLELDVYVPALNVAIEPGSWKFHRHSFERDSLKRSKGIRVITIYDSMPSKYPSPFALDFYRFEIDLGSEPGHKTLRDLVLKLFDDLGVKSSLAIYDWVAIEKAAYRLSSRRTHEEFIEALVQRNEKYRNQSFSVAGTFVSDRERVECKCLVCGRKWTPTANGLLAGRGCPKCAGKMKMSHETFMEEVSKRNPYVDEILIIGTYISNETRVYCKCKVCGNEWNPTAHDLLGSRTRPGHGCPECAKLRRAKSKTKTHEQF